ncbi:MAG: stage V sporulation protein AE [bacterium]|nr:stage V sporulation protein AE [bacterium]
MAAKKEVQLIVITDGDATALRVAERIAADLGLRCISRSAGRPTPLSGDEIVNLARSAPPGPVLVLVDDCGEPGLDQGEQALRDLLVHPDAEVLGVVAVAANTPHVRGVRVDASVTREGRVVVGPVDKAGRALPGRGRQRGDTVDVARAYSGPVVGAGDPGKMDGRDDPERGAPVTARAIREILSRNGYHPPVSPPEPGQDLSRRTGRGSCRASPEKGDR